MYTVFALVIAIFIARLAYKKVMRKNEITNMFTDYSEVVIGEEEITFRNYPFEPSIAFRQGRISAKQILDIDTSDAPPTIRVGNELLFISAKQKDLLQDFSERNQISIVTRPDIWDWITAPFLDTEYTDEQHQRIVLKLNEYGFTEGELITTRGEIEEQMIKYNFHSMLCDWAHLGAFDVLMAMRTKYNDARFADFYSRVMSIGMLVRKDQDSIT